MVRISRDLTGSHYGALIAEACRRYASFSLVWRDGFRFDDSALQIKTELQRFLIARVHTNSWPGTTLLKGKAEVIHYSTAAAKKGALLHVGSLFGWLSPKNPEDLAFYKGDGSCAIQTIAHESEAIFYDDDWLARLPPNAHPVVEKPQR